MTGHDFFRELARKAYKEVTKAEARARITEKSGPLTKKRKEKVEIKLYIHKDDLTDSSWNGPIRYAEASTTPRENLLEIKVDSDGTFYVEREQTPS